MDAAEIAINIQQLEVALLRALRQSPICLSNQFPLVMELRTVPNPSLGIQIMAGGTWMFSEYLPRGLSFWRGTDTVPLRFNVPPSRPSDPQGGTAQVILRGPVIRGRLDIQFKVVQVVNGLPVPPPTAGQEAPVTFSMVLSPRLIHLGQDVLTLAVDSFGYTPNPGASTPGASLYAELVSYGPGGSESGQLATPENRPLLDVLATIRSTIMGTPLPLPSLTNLLQQAIPGFGDADEFVMRQMNSALSLDRNRSFLLLRQEYASQGEWSFDFLRLSLRAIFGDRTEEVALAEAAGRAQRQREQWERFLAGTELLVQPSTSELARVFTSGGLVERLMHDIFRAGARGRRDVRINAFPYRPGITGWVDGALHLEIDLTVLNVCPAHRGIISRDIDVAIELTLRLSIEGSPGSQQLRLDVNFDWHSNRAQLLLCGFATALEFPFESIQNFVLSLTVVGLSFSLFFINGHMSRLAAGLTTAGIFVTAVTAGTLIAASDAANRAADAIAIPPLERVDRHSFVLRLPVPTQVGSPIPQGLAADLSMVPDPRGLSMATSLRRPMLEAPASLVLGRTIDEFSLESDDRCRPIFEASFYVLNRGGSPLLVCIPVVVVEFSGLRLPLTTQIFFRIRGAAGRLPLPPERLIQSVSDLLNPTTAGVRLNPSTSRRIASWMSIPAPEMGVEVYPDEILEITVTLDPAEVPVLLRSVGLIIVTVISSAGVVVTRRATPFRQIGSLTPEQLTAHAERCQMIAAAREAALIERALAQPRVGPRGPFDLAALDEALLVPASRPERFGGDLRGVEALLAQGRPDQAAKGFGLEAVARDGRSLGELLALDLYQRQGDLAQAGRRRGA
ncbi:MAG: hypothetical protein HY909_29125 [Deltaproteobacteria bacterium]|nr:hypothetical protein [Deltaproteobacteria bacterium]